jgi:hypothetical protein
MNTCTSYSQIIRVITNACTKLILDKERGITGWSDDDDVYEIKPIIGDQVEPCIQSGRGRISARPFRQHSIYE